MNKPSEKSFFPENVEQLETAYQEALAYAQDLEDEVQKHRQVDDQFSRRTTKLALVGGIGRKLTSILELDSLLRTTVALIHKMFDYDHVALFLPDDNELVLAAISGIYHQQFTEGFRQQFDEGIVGRVGSRAELYLTNNVDVDSHYITIVDDQTYTKSELCLPIIKGVDLCGVLDIQSRQINAFNHDDILALEALSHQIAVAIENAKLHLKISEELNERKETERVLQATLKELQLWSDGQVPDLRRTNNILREQIEERKRAEEEMYARVHQQAVVAKFGQRALAGAELNSLLTGAAQLLAEELQIDCCQILELLPDAENTLLLRAGVGWPDGIIGVQTVSASPASQMGYTLLSSEPVIVENIATETRFTGSKFLRAHGVVSSVSVLIDGEEWPFGVLSVHSKLKRTFTENDINFLQSIANILAQAIERQRTEAALRESEEKYRTLIEKSGDAIFLIHGGRFEVINNQFTEMFGITQEEANSPDFVFRNIVSPRGRKIVQTLQQPSKEQRDHPPPTYEFTALNKDGQEIEVELSVSYPLYRGGLATQGLIRDITERKRMEEEREQALEQSQEYAQELQLKIKEVQKQREIATILAEVVASVSLTLSTDEILQQILLKLKQLIPYDSAAIFLVKDDDYLVMEAAEGFDEEVINQEYAFTQNELFQEMRASRSYIYIPETREDNRYQFWSGASEIRSWIGAPLVVAQDMVGYLTVDRYQAGALTPEDAAVTQAFAHQVAQTIYNARLFEQLNDTQSQLIQRERLAALGQMAATVAHELRNPLMAIKIGVEYLVHDVPEGDPRARGASLMQSNMERIDRIVDDILYVARAPKPNLVPGSLYTLLEGEVSYWEVTLKERNIQFHCRLIEDIPPVMLDFDQMGRVVGNLISNGADAVGSGGRISLSMIREGGRQIVLIEDNGPGIPAENQVKIFEPFFTTKSRGTGLGLAIVKQIVEGHNGEIKLWSEPGIGTKFTITLPEPDLPAGTEHPPDR